MDQVISTRSQTYFNTKTEVIKLLISTLLDCVLVSFFLDYQFLVPYHLYCSALEWNNQDLTELWVNVFFGIKRSFIIWRLISIIRTSRFKFLSWIIRDSSFNLFSNLGSDTHTIFILTRLNRRCWGIRDSIPVSPMVRCLGCLTFSVLCVDMSLSLSSSHRQARNNQLKTVGINWVIRTWVGKSRKSK